MIEPKFELTDELFQRWWALIPEKDRTNFSDFWLGGEVEARFVCAMDYLIRHNAEPDHQKMCIMAYSLAAKVPIDSPNIESYARMMLEHGAVKNLSETIRNYIMRQKFIQLENNQIEGTHLLQAIIIEKIRNGKATPSDHKIFVNLWTALSKHRQTVSYEEAKLNTELQKKTLEELKVKQQTEDAPSVNTKRGMLALMRAHPDLLPPKMRKLLAETE